MPSNNGYQPLINSHQASSSYSSSSSSHRIYRPRFLDEICSDGTAAPSLKLGDKVVWISDDGPEYGVVKWLGKLPDVGNEWMAGVDFVNPIGSGTGLYHEYQLFQTRMNHASLVPIAGLIRANDYIGNHINNNTSSSSKNNDTILMPPLKPKRTKKTETSKFYTNEFYHNNLNKGSMNNNDNLEKHSKFSDNIGHHSSSTIDYISTDLAELNFTNNVIQPKILSSDADFDKSSPSKSNEYQTFGLHNSSRSITNSCNRTEEFVNNKNNFDKMECDQRKINVPSPKKINNGITIEENQESSEDDELFEIGSVVEVGINSASYHGVIRWLGFLKNDIDYRIDSIRKSNKRFKDVVAGIELEDEIAGLTDGTLNGRRYFDCSINKAYFVPLNECSKDRRFYHSSAACVENGSSLLNEKQYDSSHFGSIDCPTVLGDITPLTTADLQRLCGKNRGIQGHHNSCYLDATLFAMFSFSSIFDSLLYRPKRSNDIQEYNEVQRILKEEIVNPLRSNLYVRADRVMHLRQLLEKISSVRGLTSEEKDPEEFINLLLNEILKTDPFLKLSSGLESLFYQLFLEKDENLQLPNVQQLFDQSFLASDIKLREVPSCLMIQMPRFGRDFKMYPKIVPSLNLDITNVLDNSPRQCIICGELAQFECKDCFGKFGDGLDSIAFCMICMDKTHSTHKKRIKHKTIRLNVPMEFTMLQNHTNIPRVTMELFAVLCIETSHYVSFVKCGTEPDSPWCFFDSMADRKGEQNGYNIPEVVEFPDLKWWMNEDGQNFLQKNRDDKLIPELAKRFFSDAYICFYSSEASHYR